MPATNADYIFYQTQRTPPMVDRAEGIRIWDRTGREYIDASSGAVVCNIGYGNPKVLQAVARQSQETFFAYRLHFENQPARDLAEALVEHSAAHLDRVFFVSGGSEAVETAMKLCRQYFYDRKQGSRHLFVSRTPAYHGCTLGALALTSYAPLEAPFRPLIKAYPKIPAPYCYRCAYNLTYPACDLECARALEKTILELGPENVAAFVAEPIGGASTGALVPPDDYFAVIQEACRRYGLMLILDEVMTGFGRTGKLFGYEHWNVEADIVALSKGMAAGYCPLGAVMARRSVVDTVLDSGGFMHGYTYAGNPLACAVGREVLNVIIDEDLCRHAEKTGAVLKAGLDSLAQRYPVIGQVRGKGLLWGLELVEDKHTRRPFDAPLQVAQRLTDAAFNEGLIIYPRRSLNGLAGDHVLVAPPLIIETDEVSEVLRRLERAMDRMMDELTPWQRANI
jgi:adenosylmethionine-8-amino-7-oxononanoate aminotransferase